MTQPAASSPEHDARSRAWWRHPMVWLVIGGPALVVVASFVTLGLALRYPDPVIESRAPGAEAGPGAAALMPAVQGRNHAATGVAPPAPAALPSAGSSKQP